LNDLHLRDLRRTAAVFMFSYEMPHLAAPLKKANARSWALIDPSALAYPGEICTLDGESGFGGLAAQMRST
jgi:hypothetical protein